MAQHWDWLIVGAGLTGAIVAERIASQLDQSVIVVDQRNHIAGLAHDRQNGRMSVHYGPQLFHTNCDRVWNYLSHFTEWRSCFHRVSAVVDGHPVPMPFNLNAILALFPPQLADRFCTALIERFGFGRRIPVGMLGTDPDPNLQFLAAYALTHLYDGYVEKRWGLKLEELSQDVADELCISVSRDDRYVQDRYQGVPATGYTALTQRLLQHPGITVELGVRHMEALGVYSHNRVVFTDTIDRLFKSVHGSIPYRSVRFERQSGLASAGLPSSILIYPNEFAFLRQIDERHLSGDPGAVPSLVTEYVEPHVAGVNEPHYPVPSQATTALLKLYEQEAAKLDGRVLFTDQAGSYAYDNIGRACAQALSLFESRIAPLKRQLRPIRKRHLTLVHGEVYGSSDGVRSAIAKRTSAQFPEA